MESTIRFGKRITPLDCLQPIHTPDLFFEMPVNAIPFCLPCVQLCKPFAYIEGFINWYAGHDRILLTHAGSEAHVWFPHQEEVQALIWWSLPDVQ